MTFHFLRHLSGALGLVGLSLCFLLVGCRDSADSASSGVAVEAEAPLTEAQVAIQALNEQLEADPTNADLLARRGEVFYANKIYDKAQDDLKASIRLDSSRWQAWHLLADAQLDGLRSREALNTMIFAASRFSDRMQSLLKLAEFQYILRKYDDALATLDRAAKLDVNEGEVFFMIGQVLAETGDTVRSINSFQRAVELTPDLLDGWLSLGALYEAIGNRQAERYFTTATAVDRDNYLPYLMRADYYSRQDRLEEALMGYDEAIARAPRRYEAFYNSGLVLLDMDSVDQAAQQFDRAIALRPTNVQSHYYRGVASELQGNLSGARASYQQALNLSPSYEKAQLALQQLGNTAQ